jgi:hypothetical protein
MNVSGSLGDPNAPPAPPARVPASLEECTDGADIVAWLCAKHGGRYIRSTPERGRVRITLFTKDADAFSGEATTTKDAITALLSKLGEIPSRVGAEP